jgi:hypothetical protein
MRRIRVRKASVICALAGLAAFGVSAVPVFGADSGTVNAQVNAGVTACITTTTDAANSNVDFGTLPFNATGASVVSNGSPSITVTNCGSTTQSLLARGTDATGPSATWTLTSGSVCDTSGTVDQYKLGISTVATPTWLTSTNLGIGSQATASSTTYTPRLVMPCTGSQGNGQTMTMSYVFTATA